MNELTSISIVAKEQALSVNFDGGTSSIHHKQQAESETYGQEILQDIKFKQRSNGKIE